MQIPIRLIVGVSIIVFIVLIGFAWNEHETDTYKEVESNILALHTLKIEHINNWVYERKQDLNYIRNNSSIAALIAESRKPASAKSSAENITSLLLQMKLNHDYTAMWILDRDGKPVASINEYAIVPDAQIVTKTLMLGVDDSIYIRERAVFNDTVSFLLYLFSPIIQHGTREAAGYVIICIDVDSNILPIINYLSGYQTEYKNRLIHAVSDTAVYTSFITDSNSIVVRKSNPYEEQDLIQSKGLQAPGQLVIGRSIFGEEAVGVLVPVQGTHWFILSTTPLKNIEAVLTEQNLTYFLFYLSIFVVLNFLLVLIWFRIEKKQDQEKQETLKQFELRLKNAGDIILLTNLRGKIIEANGAALNKYGYTSDEILEMHISDIRPPSLRKEVPAMSLEQTGSSVLAEEVHKCKNGETFPAEVITTKLNIRNDWYEQRIVRDISDRKRKEWLAKESQANFQFLVENIKDAPYQLRYDTNEYVYISPVIETLTGYSPEEIRKGSFFFMVRKHIVDPKYQLPREELVEKFLSGEFTSWSADYLIKRKDGNEVWLSDVSKPWKDENGKVIGSIGLLRDITDRKVVESEMNRARQHAEEMNRMKSSFLANMSHELRTPLIGIMGYAEIIQDLSEDEEIKRMSSVIFGSGSRLKNTLNMILDLARIEAGKVEINIRQTDLIKLINEVIVLFRASAEKKGLYIDFNPPEVCQDVFTDGTMLVHILTNLMNNALKFTHDGGITVTYSERGEDFSISVKDTGIGISKQDQEVVWQEFRQASEGLNRSYEGTGLGLAITKSMTEKLSGTIRLKSEPGKGSEFIVTIPHLRNGKSS